VEKKRKQNILNGNGRGNGGAVSTETKMARKFQENKYGNIPEILVS
jgi:hypothetical protein